MYLSDKSVWAGKG